VRAYERRWQRSSWRSLPDPTLAPGEIFQSGGDSALAGGSSGSVLGLLRPRDGGSDGPVGVASAPSLSARDLAAARALSTRKAPVRPLRSLDPLPPQGLRRSVRVKSVTDRFVDHSPPPVLVLRRPSSAGNHRPTAMNTGGAEEPESKHDRSHPHQTACGHGSTHADLHSSLSISSGNSTAASASTQLGLPPGLPPGDAPASGIDPKTATGPTVEASTLLS
jgi:hypothetical protein